MSVSARERKIKVGVFHNHAPMPASSMPVTVSSSPMTESSEPTTAFPLVFSPFDFWRCERGERRASVRHVLMRQSCGRFIQQVQQRP